MIPFYIKILLIIFAVLFSIFLITKMLGALLMGIGIGLGIWFGLNYFGITLSLSTLTTIIAVLTAFFFFKKLF